MRFTGTNIDLVRAGPCWTNGSQAFPTAGLANRYTACTAAPKGIATCQTVENVEKRAIGYPRNIGKRYGGQAIVWYPLKSTRNCFTPPNGFARMSTAS